MSDIIRKIKQLDDMLVRISDAAVLRCKFVSKRVTRTQSARLRAAASRFASELLDVSAEIASTKDAPTSPKGGPVSTQTDGRIDATLEPAYLNLKGGISCLE